MLISKILLWKFIHEVTSIITFDCCDNYSDTQQSSMCKVGSSQKRKMHVELEGLHLQQCFHKHHLLNVSLKRKTDNISIIIRRMTTEKRARAVGIPRQGAGIRQVSHFFPRMLQIPVSYRQMSQFTTNQTELLIFRSPVISDASIQRSGAYSDGQRNRYVLLLADQRLFLSLL